MIELSLKEIINVTNANVVSETANFENLSINFICTDTRELASKSVDPNSVIDNKTTLFIAIKGPQFDAYQFVQKAQDFGVAALIVEKSSMDENSSNTTIHIPQLIVSNSRLALAQISKLVRNKSTAKFIGVTGSSGKTTVKEIIASILKCHGETFATIGNFNNSIGVPLSLLRLKESTEYAVLELGASQIGEIAFTVNLVRPNVAMVNNVSGAHLEGFGDLQGVAQAKSEIYLGLEKKDTAVINLDDAFSNYFIKQCTSKLLGFSVLETNAEKADVFAKNIKLDDQQNVSFDLVYESKTNHVNLPLLGKHNVQNALAAACCCIALNISIENIIKGLTKVKSVNGRLNTFNLQSGCRLIDDTYNANLESIKAAIDLLSESPSPKMLVLGDMAELGDYARQSHEEVGLYAKEKHIDYLYTNGEFTKLTQQAFKNSKLDKCENREGLHFKNQTILIEQLISVIPKIKTILVKGSRSSHMENIVEALKVNDSLDSQNHQDITIIKNKSNTEETHEEIV